MHFETIHTETRDGFDIVFSVAPEDTPPEDLFDDGDETISAIRAGRFCWFIARVEAKKAGITLATDYLGGCCYDNPAQFVADGDYYADMVDAAITEARATVAKLTAAAVEG